MRAIFVQLCMCVWSLQIRALTSSFAASSFVHLCNSKKPSCPLHSPSLSQSPASSHLQEITVNYIPYNTNGADAKSAPFVHILHIKRYCVSIMSFIMLHLNWLPHVDLTFSGLKVSCNYMQQVMNICSHNRKLIRILTCFSVTVTQIWYKIKAVKKELDITTQSSTTENCIQVFGPKSHQTQKYKHQVYM